MIVGNGLMAQGFSAYTERSDVIVYASGVSNSTEEREEEYTRERALLVQTIKSNPKALLLYFSTCSIFDVDRADSAYVKHKLHMERLISDQCSNWLVMRIGLAIGPIRGGSTLHEYLFEKIRRGEHFEIWSGAVRFPVDIDDIVKIGDHLIRHRSLWNRPINVALRAFTILDFVNSIASIVGRQALFTAVDRGHPYLVQTQEIDALKERLSLDQSEAYLGRTLRKYMCPLIER